MKARAALALALFALAGCGHSTAPAYRSDLVRTIDDLDYVHGQYFFLALPAHSLAEGTRIDFATLRVWLDDRNGSNDQGTRAGYGEVDPTTAPGASARLVGAFDELQPLADYEVSLGMFGERFPVLSLKHALPASQVLAVSYEEILPDQSRRAVGSVPAADTLRLALLQVPRDLLLAKASDPDWYETDFGLAPFNVVRDHELKNIYDLQATNLDPATLHLEVRRYDPALEEATGSVKNGPDLVGYLQILGVDLFRDSGGGLANLGADEEIDRFTNADFLDPVRGLLYFPDLRPFDPRIGGRSDATPVENEFFKTRVGAVDTTIPGLRKLVLWPSGAANPPGYVDGSSTPFGLRTNPSVYDKRNLLPASDRRYYVYARFSRSFVTTLEQQRPGELR